MQLALVDVEVGVFTLFESFHLWTFMKVGLVLAVAFGFLYYAGFGLPVLEAMSCGAPVITSNVSSLPEVAGDASLLVDPQDAKALYQAVKAVLQDESLRASLSDRSLRQARLFSQERMAAETLALYKEVAAMPLHRRSDLD